MTGGWDDYGNNQDWNVQTGTVNEGNAALEAQQGGNGSLGGGEYEALIDPDTEPDAPQEAAIETDWKGVSNYSQLAGIFRFQDMDNFYVAGMGQSWSNGQAEIQLLKKTSGNFSKVDSDKIGADMETLDSAFEDGTTDPSTKWIRYRIEFWEEGGAVRARVSEDSNGDGTFTQIGNDVTDNSPSLTGGGVGFWYERQYVDWDGYNNSYFDDTEVLYE